MAQDDAERAPGSDAPRPDLDDPVRVAPEGPPAAPSAEATGSLHPITIHRHLRDLDLVLKWNSTTSQERAITIEHGSRQGILPAAWAQFGYMNETGAMYPAQSSGADTGWGGGSYHFAPLAWVDAADNRFDVPLSQGTIWGNFVDAGFPTPAYNRTFDLYEGVSYMLISMNGLETNVTITFDASVAGNVSFDFVRTDRDFVIWEDTTNPGDWEIVVGASAVTTGLVVARNEIMLNETRRFLMLIDSYFQHVGRFTWGDGTQCLIKPGTSPATPQGPVGMVKIEIADVKPVIPATAPFMVLLLGYNAPLPPLVPFELYFCSTIP